MQKMTHRFKSEKEKIRLGNALNGRRRELGLTLKDVQKSEAIDAGQLSKFESGDFKILSHNLRKYCKFLQIDGYKTVLPDSGLGSRLENFAIRSPQHRAAAEEMLNALERLG